DGFANAVDQIERALDGGRAGDVARNPDREKQRIETTFAHARHVDVAVGVADADIEALLEEQPLRRVVVRVDDDGALVELTGSRRDIGRSALRSAPALGGDERGGRNRQGD